VDDKVASAPPYVVYADQETATNGENVDDSVELAPEGQDASADDLNASKLTEMPIAKESICAEHPQARR
jgi:hypothetical protein